MFGMTGFSPPARITAGNQLNPTVRPWLQQMPKTLTDHDRSPSLGSPFQSIPVSLQERVSGDWSWRHGSEKLRATRELGSPVTPLPPPITCATLWAEHQERRAGRLPQGHEGEGEMGKWKISILQLSQDGRGDRSQAGGRKPQDGMA